MIDVTIQMILQIANEKVCEFSTQEHPDYHPPAGQEAASQYA